MLSQALVTHSSLRCYVTAIRIVLGFPETEKRTTDLQVNVPPAATVALLAGRAYRRPTCPHTVYDRETWRGVGLVDESRLCEWVASARRTNLEAAREEQTPAINAFVRVNLEGSHALGQCQYYPFAAKRTSRAFPGCHTAGPLGLCGQALEHFWSIYNLEWPDVTSRVVVSFVGSSR